MKLENINVANTEVLITPNELKQQLPVPEAIQTFINNERIAVQNIVGRQDPRLLVVVGPCSIHDPDAAIEYAVRLAELRKRYQQRLCIVMRAYFEKPRSTTGWKGLINDPHLDDTFQIAEGLYLARKLLLDISALELGVATEALDPITPQYIQDLMSWSAIGARTTESQTHREMASGLSCPIGFKNGTDGSLSVALNAMQSALNPHSFLGINASGQVSVINTRGNAFTHVVLRGGSGGPNYTAEHINAAHDALLAQGMQTSIMVDCSHANSGKDHRNQPKVLEDVLRQISQGQDTITGVMIESHLHAGNQRMSDELEYGVSITDACVDWETTEDMLAEADRVLAVRCDP